VTTRYLRREQAVVAAQLPGPRKQADGRWRVPGDCCALIGLDTPALPELSADEARHRIGAEIADVLGPLQFEDVHSLLRFGRGLLRHPTGTGKTLCGLAAACGVPGSTLIVGPAISRTVWARELTKWLGDDLVTLRGLTPDHAQLVGAHWVFVNYEVLLAWAPTLACYAWDCLVLDEFHELRSRKTQRMQGMLKALTFSPDCAIFGLSATPTWKSLSDLWNVLDLIYPRRFGTYSQFIAYYKGALPGQWGGLVEMGLTHGPELRARLSSVIFSRTKAELLPDLPPLRRRVVGVEHPGASKRMATAAHALVSHLGETISDEAIEKLVKGVIRKETPRKIARLKDVLAACTDSKRLLVLCETRKDAEKAGIKLAALGLTVRSFHGGQPMAKRLEAIDAIRAFDGEGQAAVTCTGPSVMQSINAVGFDTVLMLDYPHTPEALLQYEGRVHRRGGRSAEIIYVVVDHSYDEYVLNRLLGRLEERGAVLNLDANEEDLSAVLSGSARDEEALGGMLARLGVEVGS
jgi:superfamily II DNA or RNA helicase